MDLNSVQPKPFGWMLDVVWLNLVELSNHELFTQLLERVISDYLHVNIFVNGFDTTGKWSRKRVEALV